MDTNWGDVKDCSSALPDRVFGPEPVTSILPV